MLDKYLLPEQEIVGRIYVVNNQKVMLDFRLALLYEIPTKKINEQVKRNVERFPADFMFQLTQKQWDNLRSQSATANFIQYQKPALSTPLNRRFQFQFLLN
jgi:hypothetical protein|tara:strand:- start:8018 stop:8320 length:303 start_codon:yes stop_codon:yes gene_type:complete